MDIREGCKRSARTLRNKLRGCQVKYNKNCPTSIRKSIDSLYEDQIVEDIVDCCHNDCVVICPGRLIFKGEDYSNVGEGRAGHCFGYSGKYILDFKLPFSFDKSHYDTLILEDAYHLDKLLGLIPHEVDKLQLEEEEELKSQ